MENKELLLNTLKNKYETMENRIKELELGNIQYNSSEFYVLIGDFLHWLGACIDRIDKNIKFEDYDVKMKSAFKAAVNAQKHNVNLLKFQSVEGGFSFSMEFPFSSDPICLFWEELDNKLERNINQINNYNNLLRGRRIDETSLQIYEIIEKKMSV